MAAAAQIFAEKGYAGATTRELAAAAGVNEVTLFRHFGSKGNLFEAIINAQSMLPDLAGIVAQRLTGSYRDDLRRIGSLTLRAMLERRESMRLMLCESDRAPELRELMAQIPVRLRQMLAGYLRQQMEDGRVRAGDAEVMAQAFFGMLFAHSISAVILDTPVAPALSPEEIVEQYVEIFVAGTLQA